MDKRAYAWEHWPSACRRTDSPTTEGTRGVPVKCGKLIVFPDGAARDAWLAGDGWNAQATQYRHREAITEETARRWTQRKLTPGFNDKHGRSVTVFVRGVSPADDRAADALDALDAADRKWGLVLAMAAEIQDRGVPEAWTARLRQTCQERLEALLRQSDRWLTHGERRMAGRAVQAIRRVEAGTG